MIRSSLLWTLDTVAIVAGATLGVCVFVRGMLSEPPKTGKRTPMPKPRQQDWGTN